MSMYGERLERAIQHVRQKQQSGRKITEHSAKKATEVFETVELMEQILVHLDPLDTLRAMQATRAMRDTVLGSTKIQKHIGLLPDHDSHFSIPFWPPEPTWRGFYLPYDGVHSHGLTLETFSDTFDRSYDTRYDDMMFGEPPPDLKEGADFALNLRPDSIFLQKLGSRCQNVLICQPPIASMEIELQCERCYISPDGLMRCVGEVQPRDGQYITLGDVQRAAVRVRTEHRHVCEKPREKTACHVGFIGSMGHNLKQDDPLNLSRAEETVEWEANNGDKHKHWAYRELKRSSLDL